MVRIYVHIVQLMWGYITTTVTKWVCKIKWFIWNDELLQCLHGGLDWEERKRYTRLMFLPLPVYSLLRVILFLIMFMCVCVCLSVGMCTWAQVCLTARRGSSCQFYVLYVGRLALGLHLCENVLLTSKSEVFSIFCICVLVALRGGKPCPSEGWNGWPSCLPTGDLEEQVNALYKKVQVFMNRHKFDMEYVFWIWTE